MPKPNKKITKKESSHQLRYKLKCDNGELSVEVEVADIVNAAKITTLQWVLKNCSDVTLKRKINLRLKKLTK